MGTPHKYADVIKAWADGETIQYKSHVGPTPQWVDYDRINNNPWGPWRSGNYEWRVKPQTKTGWVIVFNFNTPVDGDYMGCTIHKSKEDALQFAEGWPVNKVACIQITWTEGEGL